MLGRGEVPVVTTAAICGHGEGFLWIRGHGGLRDIGSVSFFLMQMKCIEKYGCKIGAAFGITSKSHTSVL